MYIFRQDSGRSGEIAIFINNEPAGEVERGRFRAHVLEPGEYLVRAESRSSMVRSVNLIPGQAEYLLVRMERKGRCVMDAPDPDYARKLISNLRQADPAATP